MWFLTKNVSINPQNLDNFTKVQLVALILTEISNAGHIDIHKVTMAINDFIEPTEAEGGMFWNIWNTLLSLF